MEASPVLSGTFELFPVAEVLGLLERAESSGALVVRGREMDGTLYFVSGELCGGEVADLSGPVADAAALEIRLLEVCVSLLRSRQVEFEFRGDVAPPWPAPLSTPIGPVLERARGIARDWHSIITAVESFDAILERTGELTATAITLSHVGFRVLELIDGRSTIRELARRAEASLIVVGPEVRTLVMAGAARVVVGADHALASARLDVEGMRPAPEGLVDVTDVPDPEVRDPNVPDPAGVPIEASVAAAPLVPAAPKVAAAPLEPSVAMPHDRPIGAPVEMMSPAHDPEDLARERADLAARAGLSGPGPVPETAVAVDASAPVVERARIVVDRSELLRMFSGLKED